MVSILSDLALKAAQGYKEKDQLGEVLCGTIPTRRAASFVHQRTMARMIENSPSCGHA
jgi:hypothetical protein